MHDPSTHREIVASVASLKSCLRSLILQLTAAPRPGATSSGSAGACVSGKAAGAIQRASDAAKGLEKLLSAVAEQTLSFPLETSKRLVEVGLPELLTQLLAATQPHTLWPAPAPAPAPATPAADAADASTPAAPPPAPPAEQQQQQLVPATQHPLWAVVQQLVCGVFSTLSLLTAVLIRACTRSSDPAMVLLQLASPAIMHAQVAYMQDMRKAMQEGAAAAPTEHAGAGAAGSDISANTRAACEASNTACVASCVAAFSSSYGLLAAAVDAQPSLGSLQQQLAASLCDTSFLPVAAQLLLTLRSSRDSDGGAPQQQQQRHSVAGDCQQAGWHLLTLALFLSGGDIAVCPVAAASAPAQPGQPVPSSILAARIRLEGTAAPPQLPQQDAPAAAAAGGDASDTHVATGLQSVSVQQQLLSAAVLAFLHERLHHCVAELRGSSDSGGSVPLLPGRCCTGSQDVLDVALRALRCWRPLLLSPEVTALPCAWRPDVGVLLALLSGALAEPIRAGCSDREALRGRVVRVAVHCLQLLAGGLPDGMLQRQLPDLTRVLSGVARAAGGYWDANKRAVKSEALPFTGQVRCVDKATGDMMVRYTMAAQSALVLLRQLLQSCCSAPAAGCGASGTAPAAVMLCAGLLPALEQLFRQLPVASPAHVAAADLLVEVLPACACAELPTGQLALLVTLRKFMVKCAGIPGGPDRAAGFAVVTQLATLLGRLACVVPQQRPCDEGADAGAQAEHPAVGLLRQATAQLLPALQVYVSALLKGPLPAPVALPQSSVDAEAVAFDSTAMASAASMRHLLPVLLASYEQLAGVARAIPAAQLCQVLLVGHVLPVASEVLASAYWMQPQVVAASRGGSSSGAATATAPRSVGAGSRCSDSDSISAGVFSGQYAVQCVMGMLEQLLAATGVAGAAQALAGRTGMRTSCSADCLCSSRRTEALTCQIGNPKCGVDSYCCCSSPKACSDITAMAAASSSPCAGGSDAGSADVLLHATSSGGCTPVARRGVSTLGQLQLQWQDAGPQARQQVLVAAVLLQSKLLPEMARLLQEAHPQSETACMARCGSGECAALLGPSPRLGDSRTSSAGLSRPPSSAPLPVAVPGRKGSAGWLAGSSPRGVSPRGSSLLGASPPAGSSGHQTAFGPTWRTQQADMTGYVGDPPATTASSSHGAGTTHAAVSSSGGAGGSGNLSLRLSAATTASRLATHTPRGTGVPGASPCAADDGAFGLLRAGSWGSSINWTGSGSAACGLLQEAVGMASSARQSSSGFGSSPSLASLASPTAASCCDSQSPFVGQQPQRQKRDGAGAGGAATGGAAPESRSNSGGVPVAVLPLSASCCLLQRRLEALLLSVARLVVDLAGAGLVAGDSTLGLRRLHSRSSPTAAGSGTALAGLLGSSAGAAAGGGLAASLSHQQHISVPSTRTSLSGSNVQSSTGDDVVAALAACLAEAAAAPPSMGHTTSAGAAPSGAPACAAAVAVSSPTPPAGLGLPIEPASGAADVLVPEELGLAQLAISPRSLSCAPGSPALEAGAGPGADVALPGAGGPLAPEQLRRLLGALGAACGMFARLSSAVDGELCGQLLLARLHPRPPGCWNLCCTNMPGPSELGAAGKPCPSCRMAVFCSKGCERAAWSEHTMACSRLAAMATAAAGAAAGAKA